MAMAGPPSISPQLCSHESWPRCFLPWFKENMSLLQRFAHGVFWSLLGQVAGRLFSFATAVVTARLLGVADFGALGMIQSTIGLMGTFAGFGLGLTTTKYVAELKGNDSQRVGRIIAFSNLVALATGSLMTFICVLLAPWLARETLNSPPLGTLLQFGATFLLVSAVFGVQSGTLSGFQSFRVIASINFWQGLLTLPVTISLVYWFGLLGAVLSLTCSGLIGVVLAHVVLQKEYKLSGIILDYRNCWAERVNIWNFSLPMVLTSVIFSLASWGASAVLVNQPRGYLELGLFNAAHQIRQILMYLPNLIGSVTIPLLSEIYGQKNWELFVKAVNVNLKTLWSIVLPVGLVIIAFSNKLMALYGSDFQDGYIVLSILVCSSILMVASGSLGIALTAAGHMWIKLIIQLISATVLLCLTFYFVPTNGARGLAVSFFLGYSLTIFLKQAYLYYYYDGIELKSISFLYLLTLSVFFISLLSNIFSQTFFILTILFLFVLLLAQSYNYLLYQFKLGLNLFSK